MNWMVKLLLCCITLQLAACVSTGVNRASSAKVSLGEEQRIGDELAETAPTALHARLLEQYNEWKGTPYRLGGVDKSGIDCSGFVQVTYRTKAGLRLPRTTELQSVSGVPVAQSTLQTGDLVFFNINQRTRHVGIYLRDDHFLHASKSRGVMISDLSNPYWQAHYWKSKRLSLSP